MLEFSVLEENNALTITAKVSAEIIFVKAMKNVLMDVVHYYHITVQMKFHVSVDTSAKIIDVTLKQVAVEITEITATLDHVNRTQTATTLKAVCITNVSRIGTDGLFILYLLKYLMIGMCYYYLQRLIII